MTQRLGLIVTDASPLITLGAAGALSCLLMPGVPVLVPDMVYAEITRDMARLGNDETRIQHYHFEYSPPPVSRHKGEHLAIHESRWYISIMQPERL